MSREVVPRAVSLVALVALVAACSDPGADPDPVCARGETVKGIDVSHHQGAIDWGAVRADGVEFAFVRFSDGIDGLDTRFDANWDAVRAQGIRRGAYQFFRPASDPAAQADALLERLATSPGDLPPALAVEDTGDLSPSQVAAAVRAWMDRVEPAIGRPPIIYTGLYFWRDEVGAPDFTASPLWHAQYTDAACANIAPPWRDWSFWQFTNTGRIPGITGDVDVNRFNGTRDQLAAFAAGAAVP